MSDSRSLSLTAQKREFVFILRLTQDSQSESWRILFRAVNGQETRLFSDLETVFVYLESLMAERR